MAEEATSVVVMTIEEYLRGRVGFKATDECLKSILMDRSIESGTDVQTLTKKQKDLCLADLYIWASTAVSKGSSVKDSDGNWSHEEGGTELSVADKRQLRAMANDIYKRYGYNVSKSSIKVTSSGIKLWQ